MNRNGAPTRPDPLPPGFAIGAAFPAAIVVTTIAVACGATHQPGWMLIPLAIVTAGISAVTTWGGAAATAWICWALDSGFVIGRSAELTFTEPSQVAALVLVLVAMLAGAAGRRRRVGEPSPPGYRTTARSR